MNTYNIETVIGTEIVEAYSVTVAHGVLIFQNKHGFIIEAFNSGEWIRFWCV